MALSFLIMGESGLRAAIRKRLEQRHHFTVFEMPLRPFSPPGEGPIMAEINDAFRQIAEMIGRAAHTHGPDSLRSALAFLDVRDDREEQLDAISPLNEHSTPNASLAGLLVMAFPELHWVFHTYMKLPDLPGFAEAHTFQAGRRVEDYLEWQRMAYTPLFDPTGFRHLVQANCSGRAAGQDVASLMHFRTAPAAVIDEEPEYCFFNSLALYRCGYLVWSTMTYGALERYFADPARERTIEIWPKASIEDVYLNFADREQGVSLSNLEVRDQSYPQIRRTGKRAFMTAGPSDTEEGEKTWHANLTYSAQFSSAWITKPTKGLYGLLRDGGFWDTRRNGPISAPGFTAGLGKDAFGSSQKHLPHSAPGRLLMVAEVLLARASALIEGSTKPSSAVHAAVLAITAKELLKGQTPTTSLEAIELQHDAELTAECQFQGVQFNLEMERRLRDGREQIRQVANFYQAGTRERVVLNARMGLSERLGSRCRYFHQVEEELECLAESRSIGFQLSTQEWWKRPFLPLLLLGNEALKSLPMFLLMLAGAVVFFGLCYSVLHVATGMVEGSVISDAGHNIIDSAYYTFTLSPPVHWDASGFAHKTGRQLAWDVLLSFQAAVSFGSLGLLLAHLYMIVSRR